MEMETMLKNYFKIAWRTISRQKINTLINTTGLAFGICACLVIYLINSFDLSFDRFHPDGDRIYRIVGEMQRENGETMFLNSPFSDLAGFQTRIPGFEAECGYFQYGGKTRIEEPGKPAKDFSGDLEKGGIASIITGSSYFDIFTYHWLAGHAASLKEPFRVVLTRSRAIQYFGNIPVNKMIGKPVIYDDSLKVTVSGILEDWKENTDFGYTDFISISSATHSFLRNRIPAEDWTILSPHQSQAFVKLARGVSAAGVNNAFAAYIKKNIKQPAGTRLRMWLQPITDIHFTPEFHRGDDGDNQFRKAYRPVIYALMGAAIFILFIAAINFINLTTAQSIRRAKETGIRKVMGSRRTHLIFQFLTETFILTAMAVFIAVLLVRPVLSFFRDYIPDGVVFTVNGENIIFLISVLVLTTLLAGFYPAFVLSGFKPVQSLTGTGAKSVHGKGYLRKSLIVFQFSISLLFIIATLVIGNQIRFMRNSDKGFSTDAVVNIPRIWRDQSDKVKGLAETIKHIPGVDQVILQAFAPMGFPHMSQTVVYKGKQDIKLEVSLQPGNEDYIPFYKMKLIAGRNMFHSDSLRELVINQTFASRIGFSDPQQAIGKQIAWFDGKTYPIVGVIADFHENSFHEPMKPVVIGHMPELEKGIGFRLSTRGKEVAEAKTILAQVEKEWKKTYPENDFNYHFLNESITWLYQQETKTAWLMNVVMFITIFISCMGLFGLALFTAEQRTKEIGIRKVLGATVTNIVTLLSRDFVLLVFISLVIASPVAWYFMNRWLEDFAFRIHIGWWVFILAGCIAMLTALCTVSFQALKAAMANPVKSLRTE